MRKGIGYGLLAAATLYGMTFFGCQSAPQKVEQPKTLERVIETPKAEEQKAPAVVEEKKVAKPEATVEPTIEPSYEAPRYTTTDALIGYATQVEPNLPSLYATFSPEAQDFGYKFLDLTAKTFDNLPDPYKDLLKKGLDDIVAGYVKETVDAGRDMFLAAPEDEQKAILASAKEYNDAIYGLAAANPTGAKEFQDGLRSWYNTKDPVLQKNLDTVVGGLDELGIKLF